MYNQRLLFKSIQLNVILGGYQQTCNHSETGEDSDFVSTNFRLFCHCTFLNYYIFLQTGLSLHFVLLSYLYFIEMH